jgi:PPIC-type PPIASE domain
MRFLAGALLQRLQKQTVNITESEIQTYYDEHRNQYEQFQVLRLAIPIEVPTESGRPLERSAVRSEMEELHRLALAGGDLKQLQAEAYKHLHIQATPPPLDPIVMTRGSVQGDEAKVFDLNAGDLSGVLELPASFAVMKLESKETIPLKSAHPEIEATLRRDRMQSEIRKLTAKINPKFNLKDLGMSYQPDVFGLTAINAPTNRASLRRTSNLQASMEAPH